jgi:hypothetical protein
LSQRERDGFLVSGPQKLYKISGGQFTGNKVAANT